MLDVTLEKWIIRTLGENGFTHEFVPTCVGKVLRMNIVERSEKLILEITSPQSVAKFF